jgi:peptidoglycan/LPS O-acetylase OafA/YrhL
MPALDGLRAVAVGLVVATHAAYLTGFTVSDSVLGRLAGRGDFGVAIFFALSAYLLYRQLLARPLRGRSDLLTYARRRAARVLPAYWVVLVVVIAAASPGLGDAIAHWFAVQIYLPGADIPSFSQSWSVPTELSFYVVLPLAAAGLERARRRDRLLPIRILIGSAVAALVLLALVPPGAVGVDVLVERVLPGRWATFAGGMVLAEMHVLGTGQLGWLKRLGTDTWGALAVATGCYVLATTGIAGPLTLGSLRPIEQVARIGLGTAVAVLLLAPIVFGAPHGPWSWLLSTPGFRWLGGISYGLFLWHVPVFVSLYAVTGSEVFSGALAPLLAIGLPVSLMLAWLTHRLVELPAMAWAHRARG